MKKSIQFKEAQLAVLSSQKIEPHDKLEILNTLMEYESLELYREREANKQSKTESGSEINENLEEENE